MPLVPHVTPGSVISSAWGNLVADHVVMRFSTAAQRTTQLPAPIAGQMTTRDDAPGVVERWTGTAWVGLGGTELGYAERTTPLAIGTGAELTSLAVATTAAIALDGGPIVLEFYAPIVTLPAGVGSSFNVWFYEDNISIGHASQTMNVVAGQGTYPVLARRRLAAPTGTHAYSARAACTTGSGTVNAGTGGATLVMPAYIRVTRA